MLRRLGSRVLLASVYAGLLAWLALAVPAVALGATYATSCPPADDACLALAERLETIVSELEAAPDHSGVLAAIEANTAGTGEPAEVAGTVALSSADRERLDLGWWGTWAMVGLLLVAMIAPPLLSAMRVTRGL